MSSNTEVFPVTPREIVRILGALNAEEIERILNIIKLMREEDNEIYINNYIAGLNKVLKPTNHKIRNWIQSNLTL